MLTLDNSRNINFNLIDDVMIGEILQKTDIIYISRYDILYENKMDEKCFHVRLKTKNRNNDVSKMYHLNNFSNLNDFLKKDSDK